MRVLVNSNHPAGGAGLLPSLDLLGHDVRTVPMRASEVAPVGDVDVVIVDVTDDLRLGPSVCQGYASSELRRALVVVVAESALTILRPTWGYDDWVVPSVRPGELEVRLRLAVERVALEEASGATTVGDLVVDDESYQVRLKGRPLDLTYKEFELLRALANSPNRVFTRELLLSEVWGYDYFGGSRTVDVHIRRLRAKLGPEHESLIATVRGVGYKLVPPGTPRSTD